MQVHAGHKCEATFPLLTPLNRRRPSRTLDTHNTSVSYLTADLSCSSVYFQSVFCLSFQFDSVFDSTLNTHSHIVQYSKLENLLDSTGRERHVGHVSIFNTSVVWPWTLTSWPPKVISHPSALSTGVTLQSNCRSLSLTKLNGGLSRLHSADKNAVLWLTRYGYWHAYEKKKKNLQ